MNNYETLLDKQRKVTECTLTKTMGLTSTDVLHEDPAWHVYLRDHINAGMVAIHGIPTAVKMEDAHRYQGDLFKYLKTKGVRETGFWVHCIANGLKHPSEFGEHIKMLYLISDDIIDQWLESFRETHYRHYDKTVGKIKK